MDLIASALTRDRTSLSEMDPRSDEARYCLGEYQLGQIYESESNAAESCKYFARFREHCPDSADGWQRDGMCLANAGKREEAAKAFDTCVAKAPTDDQKDLCKQLKAQYAQ